MIRIATAIKNRRDSARTAREVNRAIERAGTQSVRSELMTMAEIQGLRLRLR